MLSNMLKFSDWLWGIPMLVILVGGGLFLTVYLGFFQIKYFPFIAKETFGKIFKKPEGDGSVSPFQAATAALASSIGASNIVGVPVAIATGGPGAVFWMWITAIVGCATKFAEIVLGIKYREKDSEGNYIGGPMYYLSKSKWPILGSIFAFFLMIEIAPSIATQSVSLVQSAQTIGIPKTVSGIVLIGVVALVVLGGIKRIASVTEKLVPLMAGIYIAGSLIVILKNFTQIPNAFGLIFKGAFTPQAAMGGFFGSTIARTLRSGMARGAYSNEAGMGTAPVAHATAITDHPARQGMWGVFEIIVNTMIVCTSTALVVLVSGEWTSVGEAQAGQMPALAFQSVFGTALGGGIVTFCLMMFVLSTVIVIIFYGEAQAEYLFGSKFAKIMRFVYLGCILMGIFVELNTIYNFIDLMLASIIIPNMLGLFLFRKEVKEIKNDFFLNPMYYPGAVKNKVEVEEEKVIGKM